MTADFANVEDLLLNPLRKDVVILFSKPINFICNIIDPEIPIEYAMQFKRQQLQDNLLRMKIGSVVLLFSFAINFILIFTQNIVIDIFSLTFPVISSVIYLLLILFSKRLQDEMSIQWFACYFWVISIGVLELIAFSIPLEINFFIALATYVSIAAMIPSFNPKHSITIIFTYCFIAIIIHVNKGDNSILTEEISGALTLMIMSIITNITLYNNRVSKLKLKIANSELSTLSVTDALTGLPNKRAFFRRSQSLFNQCYELHLPLNIFMIDVDYFKKYNDSMGHLEGDKALIAVADFMSKYFNNEHEFVARFGGEEFVCLIPFADKQKALLTAQKLVDGIESLKIPHPCNSISKYITVSVGLCSAVPNGNLSFEQMLENADNSLYCAKESGRNQARLTEI